jgi:hypothetical protein
VYTAASGEFAVISVTAGLTVWTDGRRIWCTVSGKRYSWPASDAETAAGRLADLARSGEGR